MNDQYLSLLRRLPKRITSSLRVRIKEVNRGYRLDLDAESIPSDEVEELHKFSLFFRQSIDLPERFSVGLQWLRPPTPDVYLMLTRYNGVHKHTNTYTDGHAFHGFHRHVGLAQFLDHPSVAFEHHAEPVAYASYHGAIRQIMQDCGLVNGPDFFDVLGVPPTGAGQQGTFSFDESF